MSDVGRSLKNERYRTALLAIAYIANYELCVI